MEKLLSSKEAAEYLSTTVFKLKHWIAMKLLSPYKIYGGNNALRFRQEDLDYFKEHVTEEDLKKRKKYIWKNKPKKRRKRRWWKKPEPKPTARIYHIILVNHDKQLEDIYQATSLELIYKKFNEMTTSNEKEIKFPVRYNVEGHSLVESKYQLMIIKKKDETDDSITMLKDEYGKYSQYQSSSDKWIIYDKVDYDKEETFWVYGYHPSLQRKDFSWIFDNVIADHPTDKYSFRMVYVFRNKLLIDVAGQLQMVICKNKSDAVRLYNELEVESKKKKLKYVSFGADLMFSAHKKDWVNRIKELTGWNEKKINRNSTRP